MIIDYDHDHDYGVIRHTFRDHSDIPNTVTQLLLLCYNFNVITDILSGPAFIDNYFLLNPIKIFTQRDNFLMYKCT